MTYSIANGTLNRAVKEYIRTRFRGLTLSRNNKNSFLEIDTKQGNDMTDSIANGINPCN